MSSLDIDATKICAIRLSKKTFDLLCLRASNAKQDPHFLIYGQTKDLEKAIEESFPVLTQVFYNTLAQEDPLSSLEVKMEAMLTSLDILLRMPSWERFMRLHPQNAPHCHQSVSDAIKEQESVGKNFVPSDDKKLSESGRMFQEMERARVLDHQKSRLAQIIKAGGVCPLSPQSFASCSIDIINQQVVPHYQSVLNNMNNDPEASSSLASIVLFEEPLPDTVEEEHPFPPSKFTR